MASDTQTFQFYRRVFRISLATLPFFYYASLVGLFTVIVFLIRKFRKPALDAVTRNSFWGISGLMILSCLVAFNRGEAFLQLANFLPFFVWFAFLPWILRSAKTLEEVAMDLVITSIPINAIALVEYILKSPFLPRYIRRTPFVLWVRDAPHRGRAMVMFEHPNVLASYLVLIFGLGLGLILRNSIQKRLVKDFQPPKDGSLYAPIWLLYLGTYLNLVGVFSSGSRNGLIVAVSQLVVFSFFVKASRGILITSVLSLFGILVGAALLGIGGRAFSIDGMTDGPRWGIWQIAIDLMQERPWLGWGLGNYKFLYPSHLIDPRFPNIFHPHNFWLLLGSEGGIPLMIALTLLIGYICYRGARVLLLRQIDPLEGAILLGYLLGFLGCIGFAVFDVTFYDARINVVDWVLLAGIYAFTASAEQRLRTKASTD